MDFLNPLLVSQPISYDYAGYDYTKLTAIFLRDIALETRKIAWANLQLTPAQWEMLNLAITGLNIDQRTLSRFAFAQDGPYPQLTVNVDFSSKDMDVCLELLVNMTSRDLVSVSFSAIKRDVNSLDGSTDYLVPAINLLFFRNVPRNDKELKLNSALHNRQIYGTSESSPDPINYFSLRDKVGGLKNYTEISVYQFSGACRMGDWGYSVFGSNDRMKVVGQIDQEE